MTHLRRLMQEELQRRNYSEITAVCYVRHVAAFAKHFGRSPDLLGAEEIKQFQLDLIQKKVSWATYIQAMAALRFLYVKTLGLAFMAEKIPYPKRPASFLRLYPKRPGPSLVPLFRACPPGRFR